MNKKDKILEIDVLVQALVKNSSCQLKELLRDLVTPTQFFILKIIAEHDTCKAADIAHLLDISPAAATTVLDRLSKNDWIERDRSEKDRRIVWLKLTERGTMLLSEIEMKRLQLLIKQFDHITEAELGIIRDTLRKIVKGSV